MEGLIGGGLAAGGHRVVIFVFLLVFPTLLVCILYCKRSVFYIKLVIFSRHSHRYQSCSGSTDTTSVRFISCSSFTASASLFPGTGCTSFAASHPHTSMLYTRRSKGNAIAFAGTAPAKQRKSSETTSKRAPLRHGAARSVGFYPHSHTHTTS